jgi:hypothetical protein
VGVNALVCCNRNWWCHNPDVRETINFVNTVDKIDTDP